MTHNKIRKFYETKEELEALTPSGQYSPSAPLNSSDQDGGPYLVRGAHKLHALISSYPKLKSGIKSARSRAKSNMKRLKHLNAIQKIKFPHSQSPVISIVIPAYNKFDLTVNCLCSIQENVSSSIKYQVIIVDNASSDKTPRLSKIKNIIYVRNKKNLGFVDACNIGASQASGDYLVFLNNDAQVEKGWLESLHNTIKDDETIGLVGSKIIYPDGRLQEAGGVIYSDGSGSNYGKFDHPDRYQYNYVRDVDYCSGASIIIAKKLFDNFGGFDKLYAPAYYEDTDLCFKIRKKGLRVVYQPKSLIYHIEGATAGTSTTSGFKKYQSINQKKFLKRWKKTLDKKYPTSDEVYKARDLSGNKMVLIVDENVPTPDKDSGSVRMARIIESFQALGYKVTFLPNFLGYRGKYTEELQQKGVEVVVEPFTFVDFAKHYGQFYDVVFLSRPRVSAMYIDLCQAFFKKSRIIFDTVDLHYLRLSRQAEFEDKSKKGFYKEMAKKYEVLEKGLIERADETIVVSTKEVENLRKEGMKSPIHILSNIHEINEGAYNVDFDERKDILFVGGYAHAPNIDAVNWFVNDIFPLIIKENPKIRLRVVGSEMSETLRDHLKKQPGVVVDGFVEDLEPLLKSTRVFVAPLRFGAGVKGKVGQAIEYGIPVVTTSIGAEGMHLKNNVSCIEASDKARFADGVLSIYSDKDLWGGIQSNARHVLVKNFSKQKTKEDLKRILK